jgi:hypothetical protein
LWVLPGTSGVRASGAELTLPTPAGPLTIKVEPPPPADPVGTTLAISLFLAGSKREQKQSLKRVTGMPVWLAVLVLLPIVTSTLGMIWGGEWVSGVGVLMTLVNVAALYSRWDVSKRAAVALMVNLLVLLAVGVGFVLRFMAKPGQPVSR